MRHKQEVWIATVDRGESKERIVGIYATPEKADRGSIWDFLEPMYIEVDLDD